MASRRATNGRDRDRRVRRQPVRLMRSAWRCAPGGPSRARGVLRAVLGSVGALALAGTLGACSDGGDGCATGVVATTTGDLCGVVASVDDLPGVSVDAFLGVPYAESTAGDGRFSPPVAKARLSGVFDASQLGAACPQSDTTRAPASTSEDCLTVNVWRPAARGDEPLPVMVWIYGGAFLTGYNANPLYQGDYLAAQENVIVVAVNYRVGALGFLAGIAGLDGNFGLMDQQLGLRWAVDNAAAFGGDPGRVTLFGESAGAMSVGLHALSMPSSRPLFQNAIMESNPFGLPYRTPAQASAVSAQLAAELKCAPDDLDCLRAVPADQIVAAQGKAALQIASLLGERLAGFLVWAPVVDGALVVSEPVAAAEQGALDLPAIIGTNANEGTVFVAALAAATGGVVKPAAYEAALDFLFGKDDAAEIIALYGLDPVNNFDNLSRITGDYLFGCANRWVALQATDDVHLYEFRETSVNLWPDVPACAGEACHSDELPFVFHVDQPLGFTFDAAQARLSDEMVAYWGALATRRTPEAPGLPTWPAFTPDGLEYLILDTPALSTAVDPIPNCGFWDTIGYGAPAAVASTMQALSTRGAHVE
jgi:carboxylesterase type B